MNDLLNARIAALESENEGYAKAFDASEATIKELESRIAVLEGRLCVACGRCLPATHDRTQPAPDCPTPDACTIDMTTEEALHFWRREGHTLRDHSRTRIAALEAQVKELQEPHFWWDSWGEQPALTPLDIHEGSDYADVSEVIGGRRVCRKWAAWKCLTVDDNGDPYETDMVLFDTPDEAAQCWPDSLAAARAIFAHPPTEDPK